LKDEEINKKLAQADKDLKGYVDMKIRAVKSALIFVGCISVGIWVAHKIDVNKTLENMTGVSVIDNRTSTSKK
jgi:hypothetical protein